MIDTTLVSWILGIGIWGWLVLSDFESLKKFAVMFLFATVSIGLLYFPVLEALYGKTLGKRYLDLKVIMTDGTSITWRSSLIRNAMRLLDGHIWLVYSMISKSSLNQRWGDELANTVVIYTEGDVEEDNESEDKGKSVITNSTDRIIEN
jgi:uncharacterized RDD family membrane protein YckC